MKDFNLLATTARGNEEDTCSEIWYLLRELGDEQARAEKTGITGLIAAKTMLDPFHAVEKLKKILEERPYEFRYTLRIIPVEKVVRTDLNEIKEGTTELLEKIHESETFRITVERRFTTMMTKDIIQAVAAQIRRKVDLDTPDKIVLIEVVNGLTGISIIKGADIISTVKEKR